MEQTTAIDVSKMFPDYNTADAVREGSIAVIRLHDYSDGSILTIKMSIDHMYQALNQLRAQGPQSSGRRS